MQCMCVAIQEEHACLCRCLQGGVGAAANDAEVGVASSGREEGAVDRHLSGSRAGANTIDNDQQRMNNVSN